MVSEAPTDMWFPSDVSPAVAAKDTFLACLGILFFMGMVFIWLFYIWLFLKEVKEAANMLCEFVKKSINDKKKDDKNDDVEKGGDMIYMKPPSHVLEPISDIKKPEFNNNNEDKLV